MEDLKQYDLNKFNQSKLHFDVKDIARYLDKHDDKATKPHRHSYYQLIWFKSAGDHYVDYGVISHPKNSLFIINKGQVHHFCPDSTNEGLLFHFNDAFMDPFDGQVLDRLSISIFSEMLPNSIALNQNEVSQISSISDMILGELTKQQTGFGEIIYHLFSVILLMTSRQLESATAIKTMSEEFVLAFNFKKLVKNNMSQFWSVDKFVEELNTNEKSLSRATRHIFSETPSRFIVQLKILEARRLLASQSISIKQIAYDLGFDQATYFTKYFKKETGLTPKEFRLSIP